MYQIPQSSLYMTQSARSSFVNTCNIPYEKTGTSQQNKPFSSGKIKTSIVFTFGHKAQNSPSMISSLKPTHLQRHGSLLSSQMIKPPEKLKKVTSYNVNNNAYKYNYENYENRMPQFLKKQQKKQKESLLLKNAKNTSKNQSYQITSNKKQYLCRQDFQFGKLLGKGRFGQVHMARHKKTNFISAIKTIKKQTVREDKITQELINQITIQSQINNPNIIKIYGFFADTFNVYVLQELALDGSLYSKLCKNHRFQQNYVKNVLKDLCDGVKLLHMLDYTHRDLKPENVVLQFGVAKICDFGWVAKCSDSQYLNKQVGTPLYYAPQMVKKQRYNKSIDIWALGLIAYEMLIGRVPFSIFTESELYLIIEKQIIIPKYIDHSPQFAHFIKRTLDKSFATRADIQELTKSQFIISKNTPNHCNNIKIEQVL